MNANLLGELPEGSQPLPDFDEIKAKMQKRTGEEAVEIIGYKPVFQRFAQANEALLDCMAAIPKSDAVEMSAPQQDS